jgi:tetratricopeptide (TPR) repeat protein
MLTERGRAAEAVPLLEKAVGLEPAYTEAHYNLGNAYLALNRRSEAFAAYQAALALKPKHVLAHYKAGNLLLAAGDIKAAEEHYRAALAGNPNYAEAHYQLATMLAARKEPAEAITHYRAAVELKPNWIEPLNNLAWLLATHPDTRCRDGAEAVRLASRAVELTRTNDVESLDTLAAAYAESGRFPLAIETVQHAIQLATAPGTQTMEPRLRERLQRYKTGQPYHK